MTKWLLDTDHVSAILRGNQNVIQTAASHHLDVAISIITVQELFNGWIGKLNQESDPHNLVKLYGKLAKTVDFVTSVSVLDFDNPARQVYERLRQQPNLAKKRIDKDMRIASIALSQNMTMVTRNYKDFSLIPNLGIENWMQNLGHECDVAKSPIDETRL